MLFSINNYRAFSILLIVLSHCYWISGWQADSSLDIFVKHYISGGTFFFLFISGYLFGCVWLDKFNYLRFLKLKLVNIGSPYIAISLPVIILAIITKQPYGEYFFDNNTGLWSEVVKPFFMYLLYGRVLTGYWYIPFIFLVFLISPLLIRFCRTETKTQTICLLILYSISLFVWRAEDNMNPIQALFYFIPVFLLGCYCQIHASWISVHQGALIKICFFFSIIFMVIQVYFLDVPGNLHKPMFSYQGANINSIERSFLAVLMFLVLERYMNYRVAILDYIAKASFSIYLLHPLIIAIYKRAVGLEYDSFLYFLSLTTLVFCCCWAVALTGKKLIGRHSRYVLG
ncbi:acyltransferase family protein [Vibrio sp. MA40-2]|uniref:acyltransferase family protein n=1 Tax=Vibrio sp. MA40-2 TaxID=3391828 RepID=UPI0039A50C4F